MSEVSGSSPDKTDRNSEEMMSLLKGIDESAIGIGY